MTIPSSPINDYSQIPFEFTDPGTVDKSATLQGVRVKSVRKKELVPEPIVIPPTAPLRGRKSLKNNTDPLPEIPPDEVLFQKQYYSMGEVASMFKVNQSLLRFWEAEFDIIQPRKNRKGDRHFRPLDIKNLQLIYDLLRRRKLTIEGARDFLKNNKNAKEQQEMIFSLQKIRAFILELKATL